jgi:hypothetical protein
MTTWRIAELRQVLYFVRESRQSLREGDLVKAFRRYELALRGLSLTRGRACRPGGNVTATATLLALVSDLGLQVETALAPAPRVEAWELVEEIADGIRVLRTRDAADVTDDQAIERARNIACRLTSRWEFVAIESAQSDCPQPPQNGEVGAN